VPPEGVEETPGQGLRWRDVRLGNGPHEDLEGSANRILFDDITPVPPPAPPPQASPPAS